MTNEDRQDLLDSLWLLTLKAETGQDWAEIARLEAQIFSLALLQHSTSGESASFASITKM